MCAVSGGSSAMVLGGDGDVVYGGVEVGGEVEVAPATAHHNGIEELLRASAYAPADHSLLHQYQGYRSLEDIE